MIAVRQFRLFRYGSWSEGFAHGTFERGTIPISEVCRGPIRAFKKGQQGRFGVGGRPHDFLRQEELPELPIEIRLLGRDRCVGEALRGGIGV